MTKMGSARKTILCSARGFNSILVQKKIIVIRLTTETLVLLSKLHLYSHRHKLIPVCNDCYCAEKTDVSRQRSTSIQHERSLISTVGFSI